ncbi:MAG: hypothetical protein K6F35_06415 [Lachnospiraceae bacterium]|nr:hypothetical protein [Lachnospiraceae bacterium]
MPDDELYKKKNMEVLQYEATGNANLQKDQTELAYRSLNSGFFNLEMERRKGAELSDWKKKHEDKKKEIEEAWHRNTETEYNALSKRAAANNKKSRAYYRGFSLKELEVFIKNSDRGGNSDHFNNVATELELYNRIMDNGNPLEGFGILMRLKDRADEYTSSRKSPNTTKGKIRKAIISVISEKATELIEQQKNEYLTKAETLFEEARSEEADDEKVNEAFKAQYNLIYQVLNGNITLPPEELERLDANTETVLNKVIRQKVDETQGNNISTKFFNSLGWSSNEARMVEEHDLEPEGDEMKRSPLKKKMYHSINPFGELKDAKDLGRQLAGMKKENNRIFYGLGRFGKGIYTSARADKPEAEDRKAEVNSWTYGNKVGAVQLVMTVNEHARMMSYHEFMRTKENEFGRMFSRVNTLLESEQRSKSGYMDYLTMKAAFYGYNTLIDYNTGIENVDYYVTSDRKALSISREMRIRVHPDDFDLSDLEHLEKQK